MVNPFERRLTRLMYVALGTLVAGLALLFAHNALGMPWPPVLPASVWEWLYSAIELGAVAVCAARALGRPGERLAWLIIAIGLLAFSVGDVYYTAVFQNAESVPFPSIDDALYLACCPALYVGVVLLLRARIRSMPGAMWLDGLIGALAVAAVGAALIFSVVVSGTGGAPLTVATNLAIAFARDGQNVVLVDGDLSAKDFDKERTKTRAALTLKRSAAFAFAATEQRTKH